MVVVGRVLSVLWVLKGVREHLLSCRELLAVPLKFSSARPVVDAAVYAGPCCYGYRVVGSAGQCVGVVGGQCVEQRVVSAADRAPMCSSVGGVPVRWPVVKRQRWSERPAGPEICGGTLLRMGFILHAVWTIIGRDVAEAALMGDGRPLRRPLGGETTDQGPQVLFELVV